MANRILRDWTDSDRINELTVQCERFFVRLIMKVDDYGCFYADTRLLKANLFPLLLDTVREADITRWIAECKKAGLIVLYEVNKKSYLQINDFRQRLDRAKSKYPLPTATDSLAIDNDTPAESETETKPKQETETDIPVRENVFLSQKEINKLKEKYTQDEIEWMYDKLSAYKLSKGKKYKSDYGAILNWVVESLEKEKEKNSAKKEKDGKQQTSKFQQNVTAANEVLAILDRNKQPPSG